MHLASALSHQRRAPIFQFCLQVFRQAKPQRVDRIATIPQLPIAKSETELGA